MCRLHSRHQGALQLSLSRQQTIVVPLVWGHKRKVGTHQKFSARTLGRHYAPHLKIAPDATARGSGSELSSEDQNGATEVNFCAFGGFRNCQFCLQHIIHFDRRLEWFCIRVGHDRWDDQTEMRDPSSVRENLSNNSKNVKRHVFWILKKKRKNVKNVRSFTCYSITHNYRKSVTYCSKSPTSNILLRNADTRNYATENRLCV